VEIVEHKVYGNGVVKNKRFGGFELCVQFQDGILRWVREEDVRFLSKTPSIKKETISVKTLSDEQFIARNIIESLRLGIVPHKYIESFTFGREDEIELIKKWLEGNDDSSLIMSGEYGSGKTHFLEYIHSYALQNKWAVSLVSLDSNEVSFARPKALYEAIIRSFKFRSKNGDFREFLREMAKSNDSYKIDEHKYLGPIISKIRSEKDIEDYFEWIEGLSKNTYPIVQRKISKSGFPSDIEFIIEGSWIWVNGNTYPVKEKLKENGFIWSNKRKAWYKRSDESKEDRTYLPLPSYATSANIYSYIISGIGWAAKNILHLNGFLILFDEAENVDSSMYTSYRGSASWKFLEGLILMASDNEILLSEEIYGATKGGGSETLLNYRVMNSDLIRYLWRIPSSVKLLFAFVMSDILTNDILKMIKKVEIEHLGEDALREILKKITELYGKAYETKSNIKEAPNIQQHRTRLFIKSLVEILDISRFYPNKKIE